MKNTLVIIGHSNAKSLNHSLANAYMEGLEDTVRVIDLAQIQFDPILREGYLKKQELEPDLVKAQEDIAWAEHIVWFYPVWWSMMPAILKGFVDRVFLPGFAFSFSKNSSFQTKLLKGKTSELFITSDAPSWWRKFVLRDPSVSAFKRDTLEFCGIKVVSVRRFGEIRSSSDALKNEWFNDLRKKGRQG